MFTDKVFVITGGANGIGRCITEEVLKAGGIAWVIDVEDMTFAHSGLHFFKGDIGEKEVLEAFVGEILKYHGQVDFLINNACVSRKGLLSGCSYDDFNYVLRVGVTAPYYLAFLLQDAFREGGCIINISSSRAFVSQPNTESYTAAKGGISALTHGMCVSLSGKVRVNSISPGWIDTGAFYETAKYKPAYSQGDISQHPSGRVGNPYDIAAAVLFLCQPESGFINGENLTIDGGMTKQMIYHGDYGWTYHPKEQH